MTVATIDTAALAALLEYPWEKPRIADQATAARLKELARFIERESLESLQDLYTRTFDLTPVTPPYLAFHMHGESYRRGAVMSSLRELYRTHEIDEGGELPDHLGNVLRLVAKAGADEAVVKLLQEELLPGLIKLAAIAEKDDPKNPYRALLDAARQAMEEYVP